MGVFTVHSVQDVAIKKGICHGLRPSMPDLKLPADTACYLPEANGLVMLNE